MVNSISPLCFTFTDLQTVLFGVLTVIPMGWIPYLSYRTLLQNFGNFVQHMFLLLSLNSFFMGIDLFLSPSLSCVGFFLFFVFSFWFSTYPCFKIFCFKWSCHCSYRTLSAHKIMLCIHILFGSWLHVCNTMISYCVCLNRQTKLSMLYIDSSRHKVRSICGFGLCAQPTVILLQMDEGIKMFCISKTPMLHNKERGFMSLKVLFFPKQFWATYLGAGMDAVTSNISW